MTNNNNCPASTEEDTINQLKASIASSLIIGHIPQAELNNIDNILTLRREVEAFKSTVATISTKAGHLKCYQDELTKTKSKKQAKQIKEKIKDTSKVIVKMHSKSLKKLAKIEMLHNQVSKVYLDVQLKDTIKLFKTRLDSALLVAKYSIYPAP